MVVRRTNSITELAVVWNDHWRCFPERKKKTKPRNQEHARCVDDKEKDKTINEVADARGDILLT